MLDAADLPDDVAALKAMLIAAQAREVAKDCRTFVMVLHDLNLAARYADNLVFVAEGRVRESGKPDALMQKHLIAAVFGVDVEIVDDPIHGRPFCIPHRLHPKRKPSATGE